MTNNEQVNIRQAGDLGTPELKARLTVEVEVRERSSTGQPTKVGARVVDHLLIYRNRNQLDHKNEARNAALYEAATRFRDDFERAGLMPKVCAGLESRVDSSPSRDGAGVGREAAKERIRSVYRAVNRSLMRCLEAVCIDGLQAGIWASQRGMREDNGIVIFRLGLTELADHYGLWRAE